MKKFQLKICLLIGLAIVSQNMTAQTNAQQSSNSTKHTVISPKNSSGSANLEQRIKTTNGSFFFNLKHKKIAYSTLREKLNNFFNLNNKHEFREVKEKSNSSKKLLQHYYKGIKVSESVIIVHLEKNYVKTINGRITEFSDINIVQNISKDQVLENAKEYLNVTRLIQNYPVETVIASVPNRENRKIKVVQRVRIDSYTPFEMCYVLIDANTGEVFNKINLIAHADVPGTGQTIYSGSQSITCDSYQGNYRLRENIRNIQTFDATNATDLTNNGFVGATDYINSSTIWSTSPAIDVHWGMEVTYDFYLSQLGRDSYDGNGSIIKQYLNTPFSQASQGGDPNNAFAMEEPYNMMAYGLGDGQYMNPVVGLDVEGHEFTHLVVNKNGNGGLVYQGESGALNESFADIFGVCVEFYSGVDPDWLIGEDIFVQAPYFRSMSNPNGGQQPDTYNGNGWADPNDLYYDNGGVHINSGVQNYWFYLLAEGGSGTNDLGNNYSVAGIGLANARDIAYRNLTNYLPPSASFIDAYNGSLQAAEDLFGSSSAEYAAVKNAWYAVGIGTKSYCSGITYLEEQTGTFSDGSNSEEYGNLTHCTWIITPPNANQITLNFTAFDTEQGYDKVLVYDGPDTSYSLLGTWSGTTIPQTINTTDGTGAMTVVFTSDESSTETGWTATYSSTILGLDEAILSDNLKVYPNPTNGLFTIESNSNENVTVEIIDLLGKKVRSAHSISKGTNKMNISDLNSGIYMLKFNSNQHQLIKKLIVK
ncbi:M4 family metallopeptidase [Mesonia maritima]|uniref:Zn-dependent metalloprotease n=2 Tax=Mesonia maritima TaxID=1793873 RepID=A0ABU1K9D2_9FLAO|nr:Zn-dependent metalloprotease [Mesonia maritima]